MSWFGMNRAPSGRRWKPSSPCQVRFWMVRSVASGRRRKSREPWPRMTLRVASMTRGRTGWLPGPETREVSMPPAKTGEVVGSWQ